MLKKCLVKVLLAPLLGWIITVNRSLLAAILPAHCLTVELVYSPVRDYLTGLGGSATHSLAPTALGHIPVGSTTYRYTYQGLNNINIKFRLYIFLVWCTF